MGKSRIAYLLSLVLIIGIGAPSFAYLSFTLFSRPLHSGITADVVVALVTFPTGLSAGMVCTILRRRWRAEFVGRLATVGGMTQGSMARVVVDGVPYWAFVKEPVRKGDKVILMGTTFEGAPLRADFVAQKSPDPRIASTDAQAR